MNATFSKLKDGSWGIRVTDGVVKGGDEVRVSKKDGTKTTVRVESILSEKEGVLLCSIRGDRPSAQTRDCWECGGAFTYAECKANEGDWYDSYCGC